MKRADIVKLSDEELTFLTGSANANGVRQKLWHDDLRLVVLTLGAEGSLVITPRGEFSVPSFDVDVVDTTGAGDGFVAGLLSYVAADLHVLDDDEALKQLCRFANAVGALTATARGAIPSLPNRRQVERLLSAT